MFNDQDDADDSREILSIKLHIKLAGTKILSELETNHLAYATNGGATNPFSLSGLEQLLEVGRQAFGDKSTDLFWLALTRGIGKIADKTLPQPAADLINQIIPNAPPPVFRKAMQNITLKIDALAYMNDPDFNSMMNGGTGFDGYRTLLGTGKRIVIVAHSQGNFYANRVYRTLADPAYGGNTAFAVSIGVVAVATPANVSVGGKTGLNEPNITVPEDYVIAPLRASLGSLPAKPPGAYQSQNMIDLRLGAWVDATIGHSFVDWYLAGTYTRDFIMKGIVQTISGVNGVGGLQYPAQVCTPPVAGPVATVPQLGPYYYRDDWGGLTFNLSPLETRGRYYYGDPWGRFKNIRDEQKGVAYHVDVDYTPIGGIGSYSWGFPILANIHIADYTSFIQQAIPLTFTGNFYPQDILPWSGGLLFLSYDTRLGFGPGYYHRDDIVRVSWRKVSIIDKGAGVANRWSLKPVQSGTFAMPNYTVTRKTWTTTPTGSAQKWGVGSSNQWNKLGVAYRDGMTYTYRIPFSASDADWTNAPSTAFGWINGVNVAPPNPALKNYSGDYGVLEVVDGVVSFTILGNASLQSTGTQQSGTVPQISTFGGIEQSRAYQASQNIVQKALLVDEADQPYWRMTGNPPVAGAAPLGILKATLPANELFFNPKTWTQVFSAGLYGFYTYGQTFVPFSLSSQMAGMTSTGIISPKLSQSGSSYKLGKTFAYSYSVAPIPIPRFGRRGQHTYCAGKIPCFPGTIYGVSVNTAQKAFLMSPTP